MQVFREELGLSQEDFEKRIKVYQVKCVDVETGEKKLFKVEPKEKSETDKGYKGFSGWARHTIKSLKQ